MTWLSFEPTRKLMRQCLEFPGQSYRSLGRLLGENDSTIQGWLAKENPPSPKRASSWSRIREMIQAHHDRLLATGADMERCDRDWSTHLIAHLAKTGQKPEEFARDCGASDWHGRRWVRFGEIPHDRARTSAAGFTKYDFAAATYRQAIRIAQAHLGKPLPAPLNTLERFPGLRSVSQKDMHDAIRSAMNEIRERGGLTQHQLANKCNATFECVSAFSGSSHERIQYGVSPISRLIIGLARFADQLNESGVGSTNDAISAALGNLQSRPRISTDAPHRRTNVRWDRIEAVLKKGHRCFQYHCPSGAPAPVVLVRFCIAYEQSMRTLEDVESLTGIKQNSMRTWLNGRGFPEPQSLAALEEALGRLQKGGQAPVPPAKSSTRSTSVPPPLTTPAEDTAAMQSGIDDVVISVASAAHGLAKMARRGMSVTPASQSHLHRAILNLMIVGGFSPEDLVERIPISVSSSATALDAITGTDSRPAYAGRSRR